MRSLHRVSHWVISSLLLAGCSETPPSNGGDAAVSADIVATDAPVTDVVATDAPATDASVTDVVATDAPATDAVTADVHDGGDTPCSLGRVLVTTSDFMSGGYALGARSGMPGLMTVGGMAPDQDHVPVQSGCVVYNLLRGNDVLAVLDSGNLPSVARRIPLRGQIADAGAGPYQVNPYDVLTLSPTKAYVVQFALPRIAIVDPTRDGAAGVTGGIDLAPLRSPMDTDASGSPEPSRILRVGDRAFVALANLSAFAPVANGTLAVIDTTTDRLVDTDAMTPGVQGVTLGARNPASMTLTPDGARIVVSAVGVQAFSPPQTLDGAIEAIDAMTLRPTGMRIPEMQFGGDLGAVVMLDASRGWVVVSRLASDAGAGDERIVEFDLAAGTVGRTVFTAGSIAALARDPDGNVWAIDRTPGSAAVRVFAPDGTQRTPALTTGALPPYGLAFVP